MAESKRAPRVVIVGGGLAGIATGIALKRQLKCDNFVIYEKNIDGVGGTWRDNTYPGCSSDVPIHWYSLSTDLKPDWSRYVAGQPEILGYWDDLWRKNGLVKHTQLGSFVHSSEWIPDKNRYILTIIDTKTGERRTDEAEVIINSIGGFMSPNYPNIPGMDEFKGSSFHSALWKHEVDLKNKRVGVIGNGCSAAQVVSQIGKEPSTHVVNFVRTPEWVMEHTNRAYPSWIKWIFANVPGVLRAYRNFLCVRADVGFLAFRKPTGFIQDNLRKTLETYIKSKTPEKYHDKLIPKYPPGCRRIILDPGYLDIIGQDNFSFEWDGIDSVVEDGIKLKTGAHIPLDVIVYGTGYSLEPADLRVTVEGKTIHDSFNETGGAAAYLGLALPGFPNSFTILGPNVATGHASVIFSEEAQINLVMQLIKPVLDGRIKKVQVKPQAFQDFDNWQQNRLRSSVWSACSSYYHKAHDANARNIATFPGPVSLFWILTRKPRWQHWEISGGEADTFKPSNGWWNGVVLFFVGLFFSLPKGW